MNFFSPIGSIEVSVDGIICKKHLNKFNKFYLVCDGRSVSKEKYPKLYKVLKDHYPSSEKEVTLPDLRGEYYCGKVVTYWIKFK